MQQVWINLTLEVPACASSSIDITSTAGYIMYAKHLVEIELKLDYAEIETQYTNSAE